MLGISLQRFNFNYYFYFVRLLHVIIITEIVHFHRKKYRESSFSKIYRKTRKHMDRNWEILSNRHLLAAQNIKW